MNIFTCATNTSKSGGGVADVANNIYEKLFNLTNNNYLVNKENHSGSIFSYSSNGNFSFSSLVSKNDIVHLHGLWGLFLLKIFIISKLKGARIVLSPHGMLEKEALKSSKIKKKVAWILYQRFIVRKSDLIIVNSERERNNCKSFFDGLSVVVIPNGVNPMFGEYDNSRSKPYILFLSRLDPIKGLPILFEAWAKIQNKRNFELVICGNGDKQYVTFLKGLISKLNLAENTFMLGSVSGEYKWSIIQNANCFILPSYSENFGIAVAEALYSGIPVVVSNNTPWNNLADLGIGWNVDVDVDNIKLVLEDVINMSFLDLISMKKQAKIYSSNKFNWDDICLLYFSNYSDLL